MISIDILYVSYMYPIYVPCILYIYIYIYILHVEIFHARSPWDFSSTPARFFRGQEDLFESARIYIESSGRPFNYLPTEAEVRWKNGRCPRENGMLMQWDRMERDLNICVYVHRDIDINLYTYVWYSLCVYENCICTCCLRIATCIAWPLVPQLLFSFFQGNRFYDGMLPHYRPLYLRLGWYTQSTLVCFAPELVYLLITKCLAIQNLFFTQVVHIFSIFPPCWILFTLWIPLLNFIWLLKNRQSLYSCFT